MDSGRSGTPTHSVILHEQLQVFHGGELGGFEERWLRSRVWDKVLNGDLSDLGISMMEKFHEFFQLRWHCDG